MREPEEHAPFQTTIWADISTFVNRGNRDGLERVCARYRAPVYGYLRRCRGLREADADDVAQEVFRRIVERGLLEKADRERWPFRTLLLGVTNRVLQEHRRALAAKKRGGGRTVVPLAGEEGAIDPADYRQPDDDEFDRLWVLHLIEEAMERLRTEDREKGEQYVALVRARALDEQGYDALAERFGLPLHGVKNYLHRARKRLREHIEELVREYAREDLEVEIAYLAKHLPPKSD